MTTALVQLILGKISVSFICDTATELKFEHILCMRLRKHVCTNMRIVLWHSEDRMQ